MTKCQITIQPKNCIFKRQFNNCTKFNKKQDCVDKINQRRAKHFLLAIFKLLEAKGPVVAPPDVIFSDLLEVQKATLQFGIQALGCELTAANCKTYYLEFNVYCKKDLKYDIQSGKRVDLIQSLRIQYCIQSRIAVHAKTVFNRVCTKGALGLPCPLQNAGIE